MNDPSSNPVPIPVSEHISAANPFDDHNPRSGLQNSFFGIFLYFRHSQVKNLLKAVKLKKTEHIYF